MNSNVNTWTSAEYRERRRVGVGESVLKEGRPPTDRPRCVRVLVCVKAFQFDEGSVTFHVILALTWYYKL